MLDLSVWDRETQKKQPGRQQQSAEVGQDAERLRLLQRRKLTTNMPDCGRRAPDRLLSSLAMWPHWAEEQFFHSTSFACHTERKRDADVWETVYRAAREASEDSPIKSTESVRVHATHSRFPRQQVEHEM